MLENVSTHSRPKAAEFAVSVCFFSGRVSTHSRPKAAVSLSSVMLSTDKQVSTHSRPKAAGRCWTTERTVFLFQHTAARRRLACPDWKERIIGSFNTQPPEGGCYRSVGWHGGNNVSTHSRPKAAVRLPLPKKDKLEFQHTAARRRLV